MNKIIRKILDVGADFIALFGNNLSQKEARGGSPDKSGYDYSKIAKVARRVGAEGSILLKNDDALPLEENTRVALFGRVSFDWFYVGYGSGGDVRAPYRVSLADGLCNANVNLDEELFGIYKKWCDNNPVSHGVWGHWPRYFAEMPVGDELVSRVSERADVAIVTIGRAAGEDRENNLEEGSYYLTSDERKLLKQVTEAFEKTVVIMNIGNAIDFSFVNEYKIDALLIAWQGGMESGNAVADVLTGKVSPDGRLPMSLATSYERYPSAGNFGARAYNEYKEDIYVGYRYFETFDKDGVLYPFGYGLGYGKFQREVVGVNYDGDKINFNVRVTNIGNYPSKDTLEFYIEPPQGKLGKPVRNLVAFVKSATLAPGESETLTAEATAYLISSYDDTGITGHKSCYVLEKGAYSAYLGYDSRNAEKIFEFVENEDRVVAECNVIASSPTVFDRLRPIKSEDDGYDKGYYLTPERAYDLKERILSELPTCKPYTGNKGITLSDVKSGKATIEDFTAQFTLRELEAISRGAYIMNSPLGAPGNAGALGGVLRSLRKKGVPAVICTDGPSGIRLSATCSLLPIGTLLSSTWDPKMVETLLAELSLELNDRGSDMLLAPGMNIHRDPLCGRNFEYFSEDPVLSGKIGASYVKGVQTHGASACPKHFACNNQETNRCDTDSRLSERALREIYLKGFEICVKEGVPRSLMTSYNKINGVWGHYNYDLATTVLRNEWGYKGLIVTDWWMRHSSSPEFPKMRDNAYRVRAGVDVLMPGGRRITLHVPDGTLLATYGHQNGITRGEMVRVANSVIAFTLGMKR